MKLSYLSFDDFTHEELTDFINTYPVRVLSIPITFNPVFQNMPGIKGFRPDSYKKVVLKNIYVRDIESKKEKSVLGKALLIEVNGNIETCLNEEDYNALIDKTYTDEQLSSILDQLLEEDFIYPEYLFKLLQLEEEQVSAYKSVFKGQELDKKEAEIQALKEQVEALETNYKEKEKECEVLQSKLKKMENTNKGIDNKLAQKLASYDVNKGMLKDVKGIKIKEINALYKEIGFEDLNTYIPTLEAKLQAAYEEDDYDKIYQYLFIEYVITKMKEMECHGIKL